jgi:succinate dehydrogenase / fumarate reductase, cytochrome b subunit
MSSTKPVSEDVSSTFLGRHEFLLRRLHSLSGVLPVGAYMCVHLLVNSTIMESPGTFQRLVYKIHETPMLPVVEWVFIFLPILFHALYGILIIRGGLPNHSSYKYGSNYRYSFQRMTGMIAFFFIMWHVFHMHGWIHAEWWQNAIKTFEGGMFKPYNAASTAAGAMQSSIIIPILYSIGVLSCVFHLANGLWSFGVTWGLWITPESQARASKFCTVFGIVLALVGLSAVGGFATADKAKARAIENQMLEAGVKSGQIDANSHKIDHNQPHDKKVVEEKLVEPEKSAE